MTTPITWTETVTPEPVTKQFALRVYNDATKESVRWATGADLERCGFVPRSRLEEAERERDAAIEKALDEERARWQRRIEDADVSEEMRTVVEAAIELDDAEDEMVGAFGKEITKAELRIRAAKHTLGAAIGDYKLTAEQRKPTPAAPPEAKAATRTVVYSPETTAAYGAVIDVGLTGDANDVLEALRHLMTMVHCDFTGELRAPHTHFPPKPAPQPDAPGGTHPEVTAEDDRCGVVTPDEAHEIAQRFIDAAFDNKGKPQPRFRIPADPKNDDDLRLSAFIRQAEKAMNDRAALFKSDEWHQRQADAALSALGRPLAAGETLADAVRGMVERVGAVEGEQRELAARRWLDEYTKSTAYGVYQKNGALQCYGRDGRARTEPDHVSLAVALGWEG